MLKFLLSLLHISKIHPFSLGKFTYHWELDDNKGYYCRMDMVREPIMHKTLILITQ